MEYRDKVILKRLDGSFLKVESVVSWCCYLLVHIIFCYLLNFISRDFIIMDLKDWFDS